METRRLAAHVDGALRGSGHAGKVDVRALFCVPGGEEKQFLPVEAGAPA